MICEKCGKSHNGAFGSGRFCSKSCANSRGPRTEAFKKKVSNKLKGRVTQYHIDNRRPIFVKKCLACKKEFETKVKKVKYCCRDCVNYGAKNGLHTMPKGGYREGSGISHSGYFRGIFCGSTYELVWVIYRLDHNLVVKRFEGYLTDGKIKYYPDFLIGNKIIEIKGYHTKSVDEKTKLAIDRGYEIELKYKKDLKTEFDWVNNNYTFDHIKELYDDYKPSYTYKCDFCGKVFNTEKERKTKSKFCSRKCAGKGHKGNRKNILFFKMAIDTKKSYIDIVKIIKLHFLAFKKTLNENRKKLHYNKGESNSQFGTMWVYSPKELINKKIKKEEFLKWEEKGWIKGRKVHLLTK